MNILFCSVGRRGELIKDFHNSMTDDSLIIATDNSPLAPALYLADKKYLVPKITSPEYIDVLLDICKKEKIDAITTFIDPEIELLAKNRDLFEKIKVEVLAPYEQTARLCFDKFSMFQFLSQHGINTITTYSNISDFQIALNAGKISFPVFIKPRTGSGSVGAKKIDNYDDLIFSFQTDQSLIIQEYMDCPDLDADVYIDTISHQAVTAFLKRKLETRIGGASKTISFKDNKLFEFIKEIASVLKFNGPVDMDFFYKEGKYYLSEINPRFGGAYLHAYGAGIDFIKLIQNNIDGIENRPNFGNYEEGIVMMMYDSVVITKLDKTVIDMRI